MANTYFDWCVCIHRFFQSGQLNFFTHADSRSDVWSVCTEITKNLGTMVVEADDKNDSGITAKKILPKPILLASDVPPPSNQIIQEVRNLGDSVKNGFVTSDKNLKSQISNFDELLKGRANTLNNSIKNVSSDVSTMSRTVTQEVSAVSKGISGLSGMVTGVSGAVTSIANGAVMSLLLENIVKPMFDTTNKTIDLGRVTMQKFFEKQIAIFTPGSTSTNSHSSDSGFIQLLKNMSNGIKTSLDNFATSFQYMFKVGGYGTSINSNDSTLIRLWKELTQATLNKFDQLMSMFYVASSSSSIFQSDSNFVQMLKNLSIETKSSLDKFATAFTRLFWVNSNNITASSDESGFIQLLKNMSNGIKNSLDNFATSFQYMFKVGGYGTSINSNDSTLIRLWKELTQATLNKFDRLMSMFYVASSSSSIFQSDSDFVKMLKNLFQSIKIPSFSTIESSLVDIIKNLTKVPALNELIKNGFTDLAKTFASITEPIKNIGVTIMKALFESITKFFIPSDPNFLKNKIKGIQEKFNTKFQVPLRFLSLFKTLFGFQRTPFPKHFTLKLYGKDNHVPLELVSLMSDIIRPILTSLLCFTILIECYKRVTGSDEAVLQ